MLYELLSTNVVSYSCIQVIINQFRNLVY